jgi:predicted small secreted protein
MNQKIMKRMMLGALLAMVLQCQVAMAACNTSPYQGDRVAGRCLPA